MENLRAVLFISESKDNADLDSFSERRKSFITNKSDDELIDMFASFTDDGVDNEVSKLFVSVNRRSNKLVVKELMKFLLDNPDYAVEKVDRKIVSLSMQEHSAAEHKWLLTNKNSNDDLDALLSDVSKLVDIDESTYSSKQDVIITKHGFDVNKLRESWPNIVVHKDGLRVIHIASKGS